MDPHLTPSNQALLKAATGIAGFDELTGGGLPSGRTSLVVGGPGSGKTIFAMQFLIHGATQCNETGIFVAFEESLARLQINFAGFGWSLDSLCPDRIAVIEAQPAPDLVQSGSFDLGGMLAVLEQSVRIIGAKRIVFDALDVMLALLPDPAAQRREVYRLHAWLIEHGLTAVITAKAAGGAVGSSGMQPISFMQFMVDCAVILQHDVVKGVSQRNLRVQKYRGSPFDENEAPLVIGKAGIDVAMSNAIGQDEAHVSSERVGSGVARLDTMLGGGYYRGASVLITGFAGTAKTTLCGSFAEAACLRGERTLFVSFSSDSGEVLRNLASVGIHLGRYVDSGLLHLVSARTITGSAETYLARIKELTQQQGAGCLVIDPVSPLFKSGNEYTAYGVADRMIDWTKAAGITLVCTSQLDELTSKVESVAALHMSTLADTWIHLSYLDMAGERNRGMSIIKSRGSTHSNQVRELILSDDGVTLADIYTAGGEVLMGTMRWQKESAERRAKELATVDLELKRVQLDAQEAELEVRLKSLQTELMAKQVEKTLLDRSTEGQEQALLSGRSRLSELRGGDAAKTAASQ